MRVLLIVMLFNLLNIIRAQFDIMNEDIGDFHLHAEVGNLPLKYTPLSEEDQKASDKAADVIDFIQLVPKIDPLGIPVIKALNIDVPFLWLSGKVYLKNFVLAGVKQLQLHGIELRLINLRSDLNITIPLLYFEDLSNASKTIKARHFSPRPTRTIVQKLSFGVGTLVPSMNENLMSATMTKAVLIALNCEDDDSSSDYNIF